MTTRDMPLQFRAPMRVLGPIGGDVQPEKESYALMAEKLGVIGYWPKPDVHPDGYWRLTKPEAQFIADACNEKVAREQEALGEEVSQALCRYQCDEQRQVEDIEGKVWPCPLHGDHAEGRKNDDPIGPNLLTGDLMSGEAIYAMMMRVAQRAYGVAYGSERAGTEMNTDVLKKVVQAEMLPGSINEEVLKELYE